MSTPFFALEIAWQTVKYIQIWTEHGINVFGITVIKVYKWIYYPMVYSIWFLLDRERDLEKNTLNTIRWAAFFFVCFHFVRTDGARWCVITVWYVIWIVWPNRTASVKYSSRAVAWTACGRIVKATYINTFIIIRTFDYYYDSHSISGVWIEYMLLQSQKKNQNK